MPFLSVQHRAPRRMNTPVPVANHDQRPELSASSAAHRFTSPFPCVAESSDDHLAVGRILSAGRPASGPTLAVPLACTRSRSTTAVTPALEIFPSGCVGQGLPRSVDLHGGLGRLDSEDGRCGTGVAHRAITTPAEVPDPVDSR